MHHEPSVCLTREATPLQVLLSRRQKKNHVELLAGLHVQQPTELTREIGRAFMVFLHVRRSSLPVRPRKVTCPELRARGTLADIFGCPFGWCFASAIARCGRPFNRPPLKPPPFAGIIRTWSLRTKKRTSLLFPKWHTRPVQWLTVRVPSPSLQCWRRVKAHCAPPHLASPAATSSRNVCGRCSKGSLHEAHV